MSTNEITIGGISIDESSQIMLRLLRHHGPMTTPELRDESGLANSASVTYRIRKYIGANTGDYADMVEDGALEFVVQHDEIPSKGARGDTKVWRLTETGRQFVDDYDEGLETAATKAQVVEELHATRERMDQLVSRIDHFESREETRENRFHAFESEMSRMRSFIREVREEWDGMSDQVADNTERIEAFHEGWLAELRGLQKQIDELESEISHDIKTREIAD